MGACIFFLFFLFFKDLEFGYMNGWGFISVGLFSFLFLYIVSIQVQLLKSGYISGIVACLASDDVHRKGVFMYHFVLVYMGSG